MGQVVIVQLTPDQRAAIACVMDEAREAAGAGKPGIVVAQVFTSHMRVGFLPADRAEPIAKRLDDGTTQRVRTAYDC